MLFRSLKAHIDNVVMIILNSYKAGPNYGQSSNRVWYNKLMYYCDIDENVLISNKKNILSEDKSYSENIKSKLKELRSKQTKSVKKKPRK